MNPNQELWEKGDFTRVAAFMRESGEELVERVGVERGMKILDLGCGDGTTAIPAALRGAEVTGVDIARNLVEAGNRRVAEMGIENCHFQQGDARNLVGLPNKSFDLVLSIFGAMFAPDPFDVAHEMVRVTRSGGRIVMGNWIPGDPTFIARVLKISSAYAPAPPAGFVSPMTWGVESDVVQRFGKAGIGSECIACAKDVYTFRYPGAPSDYLKVFKTFYGPTMNAFEAAEREGRANDLHAELDALFNELDQSRDGQTTVIPANFLRVTVQVN